MHRLRRHAPKRTMFHGAALALAALAAFSLFSCGNREPIAAAQYLPARDLNAAGLGFYYRGDLEGAEEALLDALAAAEAVDDLAGKAEALFNLSLVHVDQGRPDDALEELSIAADLFRRSSRQDAAARCLGAEGSIHASRGEVDLARKVFALALAEAPPAVTAEILVNVAGLQLRQHSLQEAAKTARKAASLAETEIVRSDALFVLGCCQARAMELEAARSTLLEVLEMDRRLDRRRQIAGTLSELGRIAARTGNREDATDCFQRAAGVYRGLGLEERAALAQEAAEKSRAISGAAVPEPPP
ncbi:MAG: tetratricopeptide repeat protein [Planctomycetes bacterium]|nr:tetratricopeptide repeat protein [Planctomycetota bacterium]